MRMKTVTTYASGAAAALALLAATSTGALAADTVGQAQANIVPLIAVNFATALNFGDLGSDPDAPSTVEINPITGARIGSTNAVLLPSDAGGRGTFTITGQVDASYNITGSDTSVTLGAPVSMTATLSYYSDAGANVVVPGAASGWIVSGTDTLGFGGVLNVGANQDPGFYGGTFNLVVNYD